MHPRESPLVWWFVVASVAAHVLMLALVPGWRDAKDAPPIPLTVELREPPPAIEPPKPLPLETRPLTVTPPKATPQPAPRHQPLLDPLRTTPPVTTAPEVPLPPVNPAVPEQTLAQPSAPEPQRAPAAVPAPALPTTPPRSDAAYLNNPRPAYPLAARRRGDQGTVLVRVLVTSEGLAGTVALQKSSGHSSLDEAAITAVKSWRFVPARQGGQAVEAPYVVPIVFKVE